MGAHSALQDIYTNLSRPVSGAVPDLDILLFAAVILRNYFHVSMAYVWSVLPYGVVNGTSIFIFK